MGEVQEMNAMVLLTRFCSKVGASFSVWCDVTRAGRQFSAEITFADGTTTASSGGDLDTAIYRLLEKIEGVDL